MTKLRGSRGARVGRSAAASRVAGLRGNGTRACRPPGEGARLYLFGRMHVERGGQALADLSCTSAGDLLAYVVLHRERPVQREALAQRLWGDASASDPKKKLRQSLWRLNSVLGAGWAASCGAGDDSIQLSPAGTMWVDVIAFEAASREVEARAAPTDLSWNHARAALELYRGDLLESSSSAWCVFERERLRDLYLATADAVMDRCIATGEISEAIRLGFQVLGHDPARETTHRRLMRLQALQGDRSTALRQYDRCVEALHRELGVAPSQSTRDLADRIRSDALGSSDIVSGDEMTGLLGRLTELRRILSHARREVHLEIEAIQRARHDSAKPESGQTPPPCETLAETQER